MPDRREGARIRTDRPDHSGGHDSLPAVREVVALDAFAAGLPEVLVGGDALDARVRWMHVADSAGIARLLNGGELLLSTGSGWPVDAGELAAFVEALVDAGLVGLVLELGTHFRLAPPVVVETAARHGLALVVLHREVKFVTLTEAVHSRIISEQTAALRARDEVRERFTALALRGSPADYVVRQLARTLGAPVVLENLAHEVVAADVPPAVEAALFARWEERSRAAGRPGDDWLVVPVEARGIRWGRLIALPGPAHPAGRTSVLEQGAIALALGRLADGEADEWTRLSRRRLVDGLLAGRYTAVDGAAARLSAAGIAVAGRRLRGLLLRGAPVTAQSADAAARPLGGRVLVGSDDDGTPLLLSLPESVRFDDAAALAFARAAAPGAERLTLSIGPEARDVEAALSSLKDAIDLGRGDAGSTVRAGRGIHLRRVDDRPLVRLVASLRDDHRMLEHGERTLAPLVEHDLARDGDLLDVLTAIVAHPGNRTAAAAASHLSRSVFYQRIALIEELLGVDLDDGETQTALHLALLVRRTSGR